MNVSFLLLTLASFLLHLPINLVAKNNTVWSVYSFVGQKSGHGVNKFSAIHTGWKSEGFDQAVAHIQMGSSSKYTIGFNNRSFHMGETKILASCQLSLLWSSRQHLLSWSHTLHLQNRTLTLSCTFEIPGIFLFQMACLVFLGPSGMCNFVI